MTTLYGISNCDTVKKARRWLDENDVAYTFHDYKKAGIDTDTLKSWCDEFGYEALINKRGTTWRKLDDNLKKNIDEPAAISIMKEHTSIIKRPLLESGKKRLLGFEEAAYKSLI